MANFIIVQKSSQLIKSIITASRPPSPDCDHGFYEASSAVLDKYYRLLTKARRNGVCVSVGDLAAISPSFLESLKDTNRR